MFSLPLLFLLDDRKIRIPIPIHIRMRIREAQKHMDPTDPDPQYWFRHNFKKGVFSAVI
jgi:hypothetical protein